MANEQPRHERRGFLCEAQVFYTIAGARNTQIGLQYLAGEVFTGGVLTVEGSCYKINPNTNNIGRR